MATGINDVLDQVQKFWAPNFQAYLKERLLLMNLCNREYEGEIKAHGDTVRVSQIIPPTGQLLSQGVNDDTFTSEKVLTSKVDLKADKIAIASYDFTTLADVQSLVNRDNPAVKEALAYAMEKVINDYLYTLVSPSTSNPDHDVTGVTTLSKANLIAARVLAAEAKWPAHKNWFGLVSPSYYGDLLTETTFTSQDYVDGPKQLQEADIAMKRCGFNIYEDNSRTGDYGLFFDPDFLLVARQGNMEVKISDLHPLGQLGYKMSVHWIFGAKLGNQGSLKHIRITG